MNILVAKNYRVTDHSAWHSDRSHEANLEINYSIMEQIMTRTAERHVQNLDRIVVHRGSAHNIRDVFQDHYWEIRRLWQQGHNILYADLDVVFMQSYAVFGTTDQFSMFNYTDPRATTDAHHGVEFPDYFNCGIRYYPADMSHSVWAVGDGMMQNFDAARWDSEQIIYNAMQWSQHTDPNQFHRPQLAYQWCAQTQTACNAFNGIPLEQACAVHVHGSRGSSSRLELMNILEKISCES
jgi:hypothetical protein